MLCRRVTFFLFGLFVSGKRHGRLLLVRVGSVVGRSVRGSAPAALGLALEVALRNLVADPRLRFLEVGSDL